MNCPNCNKEVSPDWKLCPYCGFEPKKCSNPGCQPRWLPKEARFCPECGGDLNDFQKHYPPPTFNASLFFTICGFIIGKTTVKEFFQHREQYPDVEEIKSNNNGNTTVALKNGVSVWAFNNAPVFHLIMLFRDRTPMFDQWRQLGFDWVLSYDQCYRLFSQWGFEINIVREPYIVEDDDKQLFFAEFDAVLSSQKLKLNLEFGGDGITGNTNSPNTLDSIMVEHLEFVKYCE